MTRIKGPTDGPRPPGAIDDAAPVGQVDGAAASGEVAAATEVAGARASGAVDAVAEVAARLRAGEIGVDQAVELLIDDAVFRQVGRATERTRELAERLREVLRSYTQSDPFLAARIRRLSVDK